MNFPPRFAHLLTPAVLAAKLRPTYARAHQIDDEEAARRLGSVFSGPFRDQLLNHAWKALIERHPRKSEAELLDKVAGSLASRPLRPGRMAALSPSFSAFLVLIDVEVGTAGEAARRVLESPDGRRAVDAGLAEVGAFLAAELTRK